MMNILALASQIPTTGDNFPLIPIAVIGVIAIVVAVVLTVLAKKKK